ncbi:MAG TPA: hypothetical protein VM095_00315, partial [Pyrinomonadaceae bacterium]|nr:hypothetical protein [Pyrinomonadaceae bacterium]
RQRADVGSEKLQFGKRYDASQLVRNANATNNAYRAVGLGLYHYHRNVRASSFVTKERVLRNSYGQRTTLGFATGFEKERSVSDLHVVLGGRTPTDETRNWQRGPRYFSLRCRSGKTKYKSAQEN